MVQAWPVPVLSDNYVWIIGQPGERRVVVVDPGEAEPVERALSALGLELAAVLVTHHHADHVAGAAALAGGRIPVYGPAREHVPAVDHPLAEGSHLTIAGLELDVIEVPGHTLGHLAYVGHDVLLCGDTLFAGGCGRLFEGTPGQMWASLTRLAALPPGTRVCCGHEYTVANLRFARLVEPDNRALSERLDRACVRRDRGEPTLPSPLSEELETNPFLRADRTEVAAAARRQVGRAVAPGEETFTVIRRWKDRV